MVCGVVYGVMLYCTVLYCTRTALTVPYLLVQYSSSHHLPPPTTACHHHTTFSAPPRPPVSLPGPRASSLVSALFLSSLVTSHGASIPSRCNSSIPLSQSTPIQLYSTVTLLLLSLWGWLAGRKRPHHACTSAWAREGWPI